MRIGHHLLRWFMVSTAGMALSYRGTWAQPPPPVAPIQLRDGASHDVLFATTAGQPQLIWLRARIVVDKGEKPGAHALRIRLNGTVLTPQNVQLLNTKDVVFDGPRDTKQAAAGSSEWDAPMTEAPTAGQTLRDERTLTAEPQEQTEDPVDAMLNDPEVSSPGGTDDAETPANPDWGALPLPSSNIGTVPAFDAQSGAWYLKADSDDIAFNDGDTKSNYKATDPAQIAMPFADMMARATRRSHYYEYLLQVPGNQVQARNVLELSVALPDRLKTWPVEMAAVQAHPVGDGCVVYARPWVEFVYPWQAPSLDDAVDPVQGLTVRACASEYEPIAFSIYTVNALTGLTVQVEPLQGTVGQPAIAPEQVTCYREDSLVGEAGLHIPWNRGNLSPELLKPQPKEGLTLKPCRSQTFMLDVRVPDNQPPGTYRGTVVVRTAAGVLRRLPLSLEVYPFTLAPARQKFWIWRLQWSPPWEPDNVACLRDIKEHGCAGLVRACGVAFGVSFDKDGKAHVDDTGYRKFVEALDQAGLSRRISDTCVSGGVVGAALAHVGLALGENDSVWDLESHFRKIVTRERLKADADESLQAVVDGGPAEEQGTDPLPLDDTRGKPKTREQEIAEEAARRAAAWNAKIDPLVVEGFREVRRKAEGLGLDYHVFPVDEPCGTPWRRAWVKYVSTRAHQAGLRIWNTHNNIRGWDSGIDVSCGGAGLAPAYTSLTIQRGTFEGDLTFPAIPNIGGWDEQGRHPGFNGVIDEVRVYSRALSDEEMERQREQSASQGLIAYYPMDEGKGDIAADTSGHGHDARVLGDAAWREGKSGKAMRFGDGKNDEVRAPETPPAAEGWSISFWMKGQGHPFGRSTALNKGIGCVHGVSLNFATTSRTPQSFHFGIWGDNDFWTHVTLSLDNRTKQWKALFRNDEQRAWYRKNIDWNYIQVRGRWAPFQRPETGYSSWFNFIGNVTLFCYDWNFGSSYLVYPEGGHRFNNRPHTQWYGTLGWTAVREGIDDNRYMQTLFLAARAKNGGDDAKAHQAVCDALAPLEGQYGWWQLGKSYTAFGDLDGMRRHVVDHILADR
jgi:hypothetical protein